MRDFEEGPALKKSLTRLWHFANLKILPLNNTRFASAGLDWISAPQRVTYLRGLHREI